MVRPEVTCEMLFTFEVFAGDVFFFGATFFAGAVFVVGLVGATITDCAITDDPNIASTMSKRNILAR